MESSTDLQNWAPAPVLPSADAFASELIRYDYLSNQFFTFPGGERSAQRFFRHRIRER